MIKDMVLCSSVWSSETVVPVAHEIHKGDCSIRKIHWVWNILDESLLGVTTTEKLKKLKYRKLLTILSVSNPAVLHSFKLDHQTKLYEFLSTSFIHWQSAVIYK